jgi:hypothetical protein
VAVVVRIFGRHVSVDNFGGPHLEDRNTGRNLGCGRISVFGPQGTVAVDRGGSREEADIFSAVIRLQLVSFARVGWDPTRLHYRGGPGRGELQMIIRERGKEETWCIVAHPNPIEVRKFAIAFHQATGVPVARAYPTTTGHWHVEPLDGGDANVRFESIHE